MGDPAMTSQEQAPNPAQSRSAVIALATTAWFTVSVVLWVASSGGCVGDCQDLSADELRTSYMLALISLIVFMAGPAVIALLAFCFGQSRHGFIFLLIMLAASALVLLSDAAVILLGYEQTQTIGSQ
jgi:hypothetical protein